MGLICRDWCWLGTRVDLRHPSRRYVIKVVQNAFLAVEMSIVHLPHSQISRLESTEPLSALLYWLTATHRNCFSRRGVRGAGTANPV